MKCLILIFLLIPLVLKAQVRDDFSDGNFTSDPAWSGDTAAFEINSLNQLHLNSNDTTPLTW